MSSDIIGGAFLVSLRLWPGVVIVAMQWLARFGLPAVIPDARCSRSWAACLAGSRIVVWWLFFSRAAWFDRIAAIVVMIAAMAATFPFLDVSLATGAMGMHLPDAGRSRHLPRVRDLGGGQPPLVDRPCGA